LCTIFIGFGLFGFVLWLFGVWHYCTELPLLIGHNVQGNSETQLAGDLVPLIDDAFQSSMS
jgi:hypothetical protein